MLLTFLERQCFLASIPRPLPIKCQQQPLHCGSQRRTYMFLATSDLPTMVLKGPVEPIGLYTCDS